MAEKRAQRRLAAILAADVVGYSRLMEHDEAGTLSALKARRRDVLAPVVAQHNGRIVKVMGDGVLVEFASAVDAVQCAVELQKGFIEANRGMTEAQRIILRIGINLSDVIVEGQDIYGDGVNVAARLEGLAEPGGIYVSASVHDHVVGKFSQPFVDLGEHSLKNIGKPVRVYRVGAGGGNEHAMRPTLALPDKPSIAVLPFVNMSGDPGQDSFTDGLTEDIITDLSNVPGFFVIARNSTFAYKDKPTDVRQIARELGVKYILEGSARRSALRVRTNVQLIDAAEGGNHIWAERFDRELADIFEVQDEVARRVVEAISGKLIDGPVFEKYRTSSLEAYDLIVRVRGTWVNSKIATLEACSALEQAIVLDPLFAEAHCQLALCHLFLWLHYGEDKSAHQPTALTYAQKAVDLDANDPNAFGVLGFVLMHDQQWDEAGQAFDRSVKMNPNDADALASFGDYKLRIGKFNDGLNCLHRALRLNPRAPAWYYWTLGELQIELGLFDDAVMALDRPEIRQSVARRVLASALALSGRLREAETESNAFRVANPDWTISRWVQGMASLDPTTYSGVARGYRLAGLPE